MEKGHVPTQRWTDLPLNTERLSLRPLELKDAFDLAGSINSPDMVLYTLTIPYPYTVEDAMRYIIDSKRAFQEGTALNLAIVPKDIGTTSGVVSILGLEPAHRKAKVGYWLNKSLWGRGYMVEALGSLTRYAFSTLKIHRLEALVFEQNHRSRRVLEKARFSYEGRLRDCFFKDGAYFDSISYSLLSSDIDGK